MRRRVFHGSVVNLDLLDGKAQIFKSISMHIQAPINERENSIDPFNEVNLKEGEFIIYWLLFEQNSRDIGQHWRNFYSR
jgi:hypothetical protein